jgi:hypothetical protein
MQYVVYLIWEVLMAKPKKKPKKKLKERSENPEADIWEKSINALILAGEYWREEGKEGIRFSVRRVRKFSDKALPRLNKLIKQELKIRFREGGWEIKSFHPDSLYFV